jgi:hypothetical protein
MQGMATTIRPINDVEKGMLETMENKAEQRQEGNMALVEPHKNAVVNASTLTRPSIPSFETPQTVVAESTTHTDSDADCENSKNHPRNSKPDKKKKRTTNLGPRVRVMNSTAITDEKE